MKNIFSIITFSIALLFFIPDHSQAQTKCKEFAKNVCKEKLKPFFHDGNYNVAILSEGEKAELYKTFYTGQEYRIAICAEEPLLGVEFVIKDENRRVLYSNKDDNHNAIWDFSIEGTQQMIVSLMVLEDRIKKSKRKGCVAIMFGLKE